MSKSKEQIKAELEAFGKKVDENLKICQEHDDAIKELNKHLKDINKHTNKSLLAKLSPEEQSKRKELNKKKLECERKIIEQEDRFNKAKKTLTHDLRPGIIKFKELNHLDLYNEIEQKIEGFYIIEMGKPVIVPNFKNIFFKHDDSFSQGEYLTKIDYILNNEGVCGGASFFIALAAQKYQTVEEAFSPGQKHKLLMKD